MKKLWKKLLPISLGAMLGLSLMASASYAQPDGHPGIKGQIGKAIKNKIKDELGARGHDQGKDFSRHDGRRLGRPGDGRHDGFRENPGNRRGDYRGDDRGGRHEYERHGRPERDPRHDGRGPGMRGDDRPRPGDHMRPGEHPRQGDFRGNGPDGRPPRPDQNFNRPGGPGHDGRFGGPSDFQRGGRN